MDKKGNRNLPSPKGAVADSKKDVVSKQWPRGGRRRESAGNSLSTKAEPNRKPQPQRDRTCDKRPKPRGTYHTGTVGRTSSAWLEEEEAELGSVFLPGSKKQSLNHLLNFSYTPYSPRDGGYRSERGKGGNGGRAIATRKHKYNKEHFLQANCQFIVNDSGDYKQYLNNPDALVDWNLIEQVNVQVSEFPSCPICLYPPVAAKMTRCGHVYCWSCILHYLSLSDKPSRKCPICYETVHKQDLKSVVAIPHSTFNVNETITFKLMKRLRGCLTAYPAEATVRDDATIFNMAEKEADKVYSKLLLADQTNILSIIDRESKELATQLADDENYPEKCFIEQAMALLSEREVNVLENIGKIDAVSDEERSLLSETKEEVVCSPDDSFAEVAELVDDLNISGGSSGPQSKFHYFYQASDGQHIYLHAINARMLEHTYGSLEFGPATITGRILEKEGGSMTEELRKRLRYLQHLPVTCQFEVAEIQLRQPVINKETLEQFQEQLDLRRKKRQRRAKEEKRREKRIEAEENRKMGKYPVPNLHLESNIQFPEFGFEARLRTESESTLPSERSSSPDLLNTSSVSIESTSSAPSFATMLATQKKQTQSWPVLKSSSSVSEPVKLINVFGSKMKVSSNIHIDSDVELEGYEPVPAFNSSFSDAVTKALQMAEEKTEDISVTPISGKKKKKNKQKLLFTTNMACSGN